MIIMLIIIIFFLLSKTQLYVPAITFSARDSQKLSKLLSKEFERSFYWNEYKTKIENINTTNKHIYFIKWNFVGADILFVLVYSNQDANSQRLKTIEDIIYKRVLFIIISSVEKNFYDQAVDSDIKRYEENRQLTIGQGEDYTTNVY